MTIAAIVAALAACVTLALVGLALRQIAEVRSAVARPAPSSALTAKVVDAQNERLLRIEEALKASRMVLDRIEARLNERPLVSAEPPPERRAGYDAAGTTPAIRSPVREAAPARGTPPNTPEPGEDDEEVTVGLDELIEQYRALIAQPRKTEINRWIETAGGQGCELDEDGNFQIVAREEAPLLILIPLGERLAVVVPSARLVLDFATSFADSLALRPALRQSFELDADGSGLLRLVQPALAIRDQRIWRMKVPGRLAGMAS